MMSGSIEAMIRSGVLPAWVVWTPVVVLPVLAAAITLSGLVLGGLLTVLPLLVSRRTLRVDGLLWFARWMVVVAPVGGASGIKWVAGTLAVESRTVELLGGAACLVVAWLWYRIVSWTVRLVTLKPERERFGWSGAMGMGAAASVVVAGWGVFEWMPWNDLTLGDEETSAYALMGGTGIRSRELTRLAMDRYQGGERDEAIELLSGAIRLDGLSARYGAYLSIVLGEGGKCGAATWAALDAQDRLGSASPSDQSLLQSAWTGVWRCRGDQM